MAEAELRLKYQTPTPKQREKLGEFFQHIMSNLQVDLTNKEIQDIQAAVYTMLERIKARVNNRGIFQIARIVPSGSLAEKRYFGSTVADLAFLIMNT